MIVEMVVSNLEETMDESVFLSFDVLSSVGCSEAA